MRPGDLIFYGNSRGKINHVAMYIGNGQIIHAASRREWDQDLFLELPDALKDRGRHRRLILNA